MTAELNEVMTEMLALVRAAIDTLDVLPHEPGCGWEQNEPKCDFGCETGVLCVPTKNVPWPSVDEARRRELSIRV